MRERRPEDLLDEAEGVRAGEGLDEAKLFEYLRAHLPELAEPFSLKQFRAGFSNLTYLVRAGERELVLRRPPFGANIKTAHDMRREHHILSKLFPVYPKVPRTLLYCEDERIIGAPFYLMERIGGVILRARPPVGLQLSTDVMRRVSEAFVRNLVEIHEVDYASAGLGELGQPRGYARRQIEGWTKRYLNARTDDVPSVERLAAWLAEHLPPDAPDSSGTSALPGASASSGALPSALIHNDYKYDNVVLAPDDLGRVVGVLDWEMATVGDPLMDLGTTLGYWIDPEDPDEWQRNGFGLTTLPGNLRRGELLERYAQQRGCEVPHAVFYYAYGLLKIAVIAQQIYRRYRQGLTQDARFAALGKLVRACGELAGRAIEKGRIERLG